MWLTAEGRMATNTVEHSRASSSAGDHAAPKPATLSGVIFCTLMAAFCFWLNQFFDAPWGVAGAVLGFCAVGGLVEWLQERRRARSSVRPENVVADG